MKMIIVLFAFLASFAEKIVGHPNAQRQDFGRYNYPNQATGFPELESYWWSFGQYPPSQSSQSDIQRAAIPGPYACATCPHQRASYFSNENPSPVYSMPGYGNAQRFSRSVGETTRGPVVERVEVPFSLAYPSENSELPYTRSVISALESMGLGQITIPSEGKGSTRLEIPVDATILSIHRNPTPKNRQSQNSQLVSAPPEGYGMYYNMRVQSFNSMPDQFPDQASTETIPQAKESKFDEQQDKVLAGIEQLLMGEYLVLSQQEELESLAKREFGNQETYLREIKKQVNKLRKDGDSKDKVGTLLVQPGLVSVQVTLDGENVTEASELGRRVVTSPAPDTTSTIPTTPETTTESVASDESKSVQKTSKSFATIKIKS